MTKPTLALLVCCLALAATHAQDTGGSGLSVVDLISSTTEPTTAPTPTTLAPTTTKPATTTKTPTTTTPSPTTSTPEPTTDAPTTEPVATTEAPVETAAPAVEGSNSTATISTEAPTVEPEAGSAAPEATVATADEAETAAPEAASSVASWTSTTTDASSAASASKKSSSSTTSSSSSGSNNKEASTSTSSGDSNVVQFAVVAVGILAVVLVAAMSVFFYQKRRAALAEEEEEDEKYSVERIRPAPRDMTLDMAPTTTMATTAAATQYDHYSTPHAVMEFEDDDLHDAKIAAVGQTQWNQPRVTAFRDSEELVSVPLAQPRPVSERTTAVAATFLASNEHVNDVEGGDDEERGTHVQQVAAFDEEEFHGSPMEPRITRFRGKSEVSLADDSDFAVAMESHEHDATASHLEQYSHAELRSFSVTGSDAGVELASTGLNAAEVAALGQYYDVADDVDVDDVDLDIDDDEEEEEEVDVDIDDERDSEFLAQGRPSTASSVSEFHDSTVDRFSELEEGEFEV